jgi:ribosomal protein S18 acetylase RimI-like enzyme
MEFLSFRGTLSNMDSIVINLVGEQQIDAVVALFEAQLREHKIDTASDDLRNAVQKIIADPGYGFLLAAIEDGGTPIGVAYAASLLSLEHGGISGWLEELYVLPERRGQGIGSRLIAEVIAEGRKRDWRAVDLEVDITHERASALYLRHQFRPLSRSRFYRML